MPSRQEMIDWMEERGAKVTSSVTKETTGLIVGIERGQRKYHDAMKKGVMILPWEMFVYLGWHEDREDFNLPEGAIGDADLYREVCIAMTHILDCLYAHTVDRPELLEPFKRGARALDILLSTAWKPSDESDPGGDAVSGEDSGDPFRNQKIALQLWLDAIIEAAKVQERYSLSENEGEDG